MNKFDAARDDAANFGRDEDSTVHVGACPTCGALAQAIAGEVITYRHVETTHAAYDFIRELYRVTFGEPGTDWSIPQLCEKLLAKAEKQKRLGT